MLKLESRHEAVASAVAELAAELGVTRLALATYPEEGNHYAHCDLGELTASGFDRDPAEALRKMVDDLNKKIASPPPAVLRSAAAVKGAAKGLIEEYRQTDDGKTVFGPILDEIADRIDALQVKD